ncbi:uncharacterized protein LOC127625869 isoform X2 [Xyrauchen texanus]|uniref:uncharacterized protein LOC127625869 isoform X2 n=1 Tax=Xyrauchen texanus TaxID=154827 RepID=UPI0022425035|nr:uncharacterized protein LOC127625869 isoform X2 [Xyrauchen texanus]
MYHRAEIHLPRKKKVWESFHSNTFRIFDETLPERLDPTNVYQNHKYPTRDLQQSEFNWWSNSFSRDVSRKAPYSKASTQRSDFQPIRDVPLTRVREADRPSATRIIPALCSLDQLCNVQNHSTSQDQMTAIPKKASRSVRVERWEATGPSTFHSAEGSRLPSAGTANLLNCSQLNLVSAQQMWEHGEAHSIRQEP